MYFVPDSTKIPESIFLNEKLDSLMFDLFLDAALLSKQFDVFSHFSIPPVDYIFFLSQGLFAQNSALIHQKEAIWKVQRVQVVPWQVDQQKWWVLIFPLADNLHAFKQGKFIRSRQLSFTMPIFESASSIFQFILDLSILLLFPKVIVLDKKLSISYSYLWHQFLSLFLMMKKKVPYLLFAHLSFLWFLSSFPVFPCYSVCE